MPATAYQLGWLAATSAAGWHFYKLGEPYTAIDQNGVEHEARSFPAAGKALLLFLALSNYWCAQAAATAALAARGAEAHTRARRSAPRLAARRRAGPRRW